MSDKVSILMLTHNAPAYVYKSIISLNKKTVDVKYELIVVDNASACVTRFLLKRLYKKGYITKLQLNSENVLFAKGNNQASKMCAPDSSHILLLNSDINVISGDWLKRLLSIHPQSGGISSFGAVLSEPVRADGYCMLINKELYQKYLLDEQLEWFWSVTKIESQMLNEGLSVRAVVNHEKYLHHYGQKSGRAYVGAKGMDLTVDAVATWFNQKKIEVIDNIDVQ